MDDVRNTFAIFLVSGFWHGANWTFIIWGALNAIYFLPLLLTKNNRKNLGVVAEGKLLPSFRELFAMLTTFVLTVFAWIFFRAESLSHAFSYIGGIFSNSIFETPKINNSIILVSNILLILIIDWFGRAEDYPLKRKINYSIISKILYSYILWNLIIGVLGNKEVEFIYFQF